MPTVLVTDFTFGNLDVEASILGPLGCVLEPRQCRTEADLLGAVAGADYVLTQFAPVNARVITAMGRARLIVRYGIGYDNVDVAAAAARGIAVCNVPDYCTDEVADHTLGLILTATRGLDANGRAVREGGWALAAPLAQMRALRGLTVGVVGLGRIGREVAARLAPFRCRLLAYDPYAPPGAAASAGAEAVGLADLLGRSDVVTLHCPSTPETRKLLGREALAAMRPGAVLVNVARGDLVDTDALVEALRSGRLAAAALDVTDPEPPPADSPLRAMGNVVLTAHVASASPAAARKLREGAAGTVAAAVRGERPANVVNGVEI